MTKKKIGLLIAVFMLFVVPVSHVFSQQYSKSERQDFFVTYLRSEGFQPSVNEYGNVEFRYEGGNYYVVVEDNDTGYFSLVYPGFWRLESRADRIAAASVASAVTRNWRVVKVWLNENETNVYISAEMFVVNLKDFSRFFYRLLSIITSARNDFNSQMQ